MSPAELIIRAMDTADITCEAISSTTFFSEATRTWIQELLSSNSDLQDCATIAIGVAYIFLMVTCAILAASTWGNNWTASLAHSLRTIAYQVAVCTKVTLFLSVELVLCPIVFGIAIDGMTLDIRHSSFDLRYSSFQAAPILSMLLYWVAGIALFLQLSLFASALRQVLKRDIYLMMFRDVSLYFIFIVIRHLIFWTARGPRFSSNSGAY